jgi:hypothetical protein
MREMSKMPCKRYLTGIEKQKLKKSVWKLQLSNKKYMLRRHHIIFSIGPLVPSFATAS